MKSLKLTVCFVVMVLAVNVMSAQVMKNQNVWTKAEKQNFVNVYTQSLKNSNTGVAESALMNIMKMKLENPDLDYSKTTKTIKKLRNSGSIEYYKLAVAYTILNNPEFLLTVDYYVSINDNKCFFYEVAKDINVNKQILANL